MLKRYRKQNLTTNLKIIRIRKGFSQEYVARKLNISSRTYWSIENGKIEPKVSLAQDIAEVLHEDLYKLFPPKKKSKYYKEEDEY